MHFHPLRMVRTNSGGSLLYQAFCLVSNSQLLHLVIFYLFLSHCRTDKLFMYPHWRMAHTLLVENLGRNAGLLLGGSLLSIIC